LSIPTPVVADCFIRGVINNITKFFSSLFDFISFVEYIESNQR
jgi:hypothetical protein